MAANLGKELAALDFAKLLGGPMTAAINAQAQSAMVTLSFIGSDIFIGEDGDLKSVKFNYEKMVPNDDGFTEPQTQSLTVPLIAMAPIPYIRIETLMIDLNVKLHSVVDTKIENKLDITATGKSPWYSPVSLHVKATERNTITHNTNIDREYTMHVQLRAVQDEIPGGLSKMLEILQQAVESQGGKDKSK